MKVSYTKEELNSMKELAKSLDLVPASIIDEYVTNEAIAKSGNVPGIMETVVTDSGIYMSINPDFVIDIMKVYGEVCRPMVSIAKAMISMIEALSGKFDAFSEKWMTYSNAIAAKEEAADKAEKAEAKIKGEL